MSFASKSPVPYARATKKRQQRDGHRRHRSAGLFADDHQPCRSAPLDSNHVNTEEARLKYRYLDLRRPEMAQRLKTRAKITSFVRRFMDDHGFLDIETPMLTKATPEGARDYLVPSRVHKGKFYARRSLLSCLNSC